MPLYYEARPGYRRFVGDKGRMGAPIELLGPLLRTQFAAEECLGKHGKLVVLDFALFVELHLRLHGLAPAALAFLGDVTLIVSH